MAKKKRLIDANALKLKAWPEEVTGEGIIYVEDIDNAPTVDAVEVVHGRWIEKQEPIPWCEDDVDIFYECSMCHCHTQAVTNYCPSCGAKMDLKEETK